MLFSHEITVEILKLVSSKEIRYLSTGLCDVFVHHILSEIVMATHECESKTALLICCCRSQIHRRSAEVGFRCTNNK